MYRTIFPFAEIDGFDVPSCYGSYRIQVTYPGSNRIVIQMLDSVSFLQLSKLRTMIFHEAILGYFHNARERGFLQAFLHSLPPVNYLDEYIFHKKPKCQHMINQTQQNSWCCKLLDKGLEKNLIKTYIPYP